MTETIQPVTPTTGVVSGRPLGVSSLAGDIQRQRQIFERSVTRWSLLVATQTILLTAGIGAILFDAVPQPVERLSTTATVVLLTPLTLSFAMAAASYAKARRYRDKYIGKEIVARSLPATVRLLREEFPEHAPQRLNFALHNLQAVYDDAIPPKKRSYNIGVNKIFRLGFQEDDTTTSRANVIEGATTKAVRARPVKPKLIE